MYRTKDQVASEFIAEGQRRGITPRGIVICIATGLVESNLTVYANAKVPGSLALPHDAVGADSMSVGPLQQQVVMGNGWWWGPVEVCQDPTGSAGLFYDRLVKFNYAAATTDAAAGAIAQAIQSSAFPDRYATRMAEAQGYYNRLASGAVPVPTSPWRGDPVWLPEVLRAEGLACDIYPGAFDRGHGDFGEIWGVVAHHTGAPAGSTPGPGVIAQHPSLGLASQLYLGRDGKYTLCGVGIAWHAGQGAYPGLPTNDANRLTIGIEAENSGTEGWSPAQYSAYVKGVAAILRRLGHDSSRVIGHKEWAGKSQGKWDPGGIDMPEFRRDVQTKIESKSGADDMAQVPQDQWDKVYQELTKEYPSRSIYRTPGEGLVDTATGMSLNQDAMLHQELIERLAIQYGDHDAIGRIAKVAAGQGANPTDQWAISHATEVLRQIPATTLQAWNEAAK